MRQAIFTANMMSRVNLVWCVPYKLLISPNTIYQSHCWDSFAVLCWLLPEQHCPGYTLARGQIEYVLLHCQKHNFHSTVNLILSKLLKFGKNKMGIWCVSTSWVSLNIKAIFSRGYCSIPVKMDNCMYCMLVWFLARKLMKLKSVSLFIKKTCCPCY